MNNLLSGLLRSAHTEWEYCARRIFMGWGEGRNCSSESYLFFFRFWTCIIHSCHLLGLPSSYLQLEDGPEHLVGSIGSSIWARQGQDLRTRPPGKQTRREVDLRLHSHPVLTPAARALQGPSQFDSGCLPMSANLASVSLLPLARQGVHCDRHGSGRAGHFWLQE